MSLRAGLSEFRRSPLGVLVSAGLLAGAIAVPIGLFLFDEGRAAGPPAKPARSTPRR